MAKGNENLRRAAVVLLSNKREERERYRGIVFGARENGGKLQDINPENPNEVGIKSDVEEWIIISWELEIELLDRNIEIIEKWLILNEFDY